MELNVMIKGTKESGYFNYDENTGIDPEPGFYATILDTIAERGNFTWYVYFIMYCSVVAFPFFIFCSSFIDLSPA